MTKLTFHAIYAGFGIFDSPAQQASWATLLDADGNPVPGVAPLDCDGADHKQRIYAVIDDWHLEQDRINGTGDYDETTTQEHAA